MTPAHDTATPEASPGRLRRQYLHAFVSAACVGPFLSYVLAAAGWTPREIGWATALLTASAVATAPLWGLLDDRLHGGAARWSLLCTAVASAVLTVAVMRWGVPATLASVAFMGSSSGSIEALLTSRALRDPRTAARLGATRSLGSIGWIVGLALGGLLLTVNSSAGFVFLLAGAAALTAPRPSRGPGAPETGGDGEPRPRSRPPLRAVFSVLSITFPLPLSTAALIYFTAGWAHDDLGAGPLVAVAPLALSAALELPAFVAVDRIARRLSARWLCALAFPPLGTAVLVLATFPGRGALFGVQPLVALSFTFWFVGQSRLMAERVPPYRLASALTLVSTLGRGVAGPLAGTVGGAIAATGGYPTLFLTLAIVCLLGFLRALVAAWGSPGPAVAAPADATPPQTSSGLE